MKIKKDLTGQRFGKLTVLERAPNRGHLAYWHCECDCGNRKEVQQGNMLAGNTNSRGCGSPSSLRPFTTREEAELRWRRSKTHRRNLRHGMSRTRVWHTWNSMLDRCNNPSNSRYRGYGGRGITICPEWHQFERFADWAYANGYTNTLTIDRIDNDGNYEPRNCRFITKSENSRWTRNTKLDPKKVREIRKLSRKGMSTRELGSMMGVCGTTILAVLKGLTRKDV
jgi:hypothetical protein